MVYLVYITCLRIHSGPLTAHSESFLKSGSLNTTPCLYTDICLCMMSHAC